MKHKILIPDPILIVLAIVCITAFQLYWLVQNYGREKRSMVIKSEAAFRESVMKLQVFKLKLDGFNGNVKDSGNTNIKIVMNTGDGIPDEGYLPKAEMITSVNVIRNKLSDSFQTKHDSGRFISITVDKNGPGTDKNITRIERDTMGPSIKGNRILKLLYGVDSLQEPLRLTEIDSAFKKALAKEKLTIPFSITKKDSVDALQKPMSNEVMVGFAHPVAYKLTLGNSFPYLIRQIIQPILFSILLLGITVLAFVVLYRNLRRQKKLAEEKNEFISNITHELKTPIATVGVAIEALKNFNAMDDPERTKEYLDISQNELHRLGLLVDKVLKLSMFENREVELKMEPVNLQQVVEEVVSSLKLQLEKYHAVVTIQHEGELTITGDRMHLLSVVFNLLDNALKYSKEAPLIKIDLKQIDNAVILKISDNGIGISAEYNDKVFDKFYRIPHGDTHNAKGYGLGLSYVAQVIQKHNGTIVMNSQPGIGTSFTIALPKSAEANIN
jgi:two-component system phosphate regulon sensor histidine kinase PhoR